MADAGIFVGWGPPVRGREKKGLDVFNEAVAYWGKQQEDGAIESFEVAFLAPHGGDLSGFALIRGSGDQLDALRRSDEFIRLNVRAAQIVENFGVVDADLGDGIAEQLAVYQAAIDELV